MTPEASPACCTSHPTRVRCSRPLAKAVLQPRTASDAVAAIAEAVAIALTAPAGPVYLGVPADVLNAPATGRAASIALNTPLAPSADDITAATALLTRARRPAIWIGGGAVAGNADIDTLAWRLGAPVFATYAARGLLPSGHPLLVDVPAMEPRARALLADADLLLVIGSALDGMTTANWSLPRPTTVIDVNVDPSGNLMPDLTITADAAAFIDAFTLRLSPREPWADSPFRIRDDVRHTAATDERTRDAAEFVDSVERAWPGDNVVVCDMSVGGYWVGGYAAVQHPRRLLYPVGWGTLGYGLPAAIGAAAAGTPTLAVVGDGGLAMAHRRARHRAAVRVAAHAPGRRRRWATECSASINSTAATPNEASTCCHLAGRHWPRRSTSPSARSAAQTSSGTPCRGRRPRVRPVSWCTHPRSSPRIRPHPVGPIQSVDVHVR